VNLDRKNIVDQLESAAVRWDAYLEDLPANKQDRFWPSDTSPLYAKKHNPFVLFDDVKNNPARMAHVRKYSKLADDLNDSNAPRFVWISPNQCNDMHGGVYSAVAGHPETPCPYGSTKDDANDAALKHKADAFVKTAVDIITHSRAWTSKSAIVVVTDENDFTGNETTGGWESADGCCDSPYVPKGDAGGVGGLARRDLRRRPDPRDRRHRERPAAPGRPHPVQPLLAAHHDRGQLGPAAPRSRGRYRRRRRPDVEDVPRPRLNVRSDPAWAVAGQPGVGRVAAEVVRPPAGALIPLHRTRPGNTSVTPRR
jgi:hypothetical protein